MSEEVTELLITKMRLRPDGKGIDLYAKGHKYVDTTLFDPAELVDAGYNHEDLQAGAETPCRFWAGMTEGKPKPNSDTGAHYLDVQYLRPFEAGTGPAADVDLAPILAELRAIRGLLALLVEGQGVTVPQAPAPEQEQEQEPAPPLPAEDEPDLDDVFVPRDDAPPAAGNGDGKPPTSPQALVAHLRVMGRDVSGAGWLFGQLKHKVDDFVTWPLPGDTEGWASVTEAAEGITS